MQRIAREVQKVEKQAQSSSEAVSRVCTGGREGSPGSRWLEGKGRLYSPTLSNTPPKGRRINDICGVNHNR